MDNVPWVDPIVEEIRREREAYAAKFNFDVDAIFRDIQRRQKESGRTYVTLQKKTAPKPKRKARAKSKK
jgi:hypothetical protein